MGSQINLERVFIAATYLKAKGAGILSQTYISANLCQDIPFFYSFNREFAAFSTNNVSSVLQVGLNLRYEASLLNTLLRREQSRRALAYFTIGVSIVLRYLYTQQGNSFRSLYTTIENRSQFVKEVFFKAKPIVVLAGVNMFRNNQSIFRQRILRKLGKQFFVKTRSTDRLGFIHSSVGSLAFAHLGIQTKARNTVSPIFAVAQPNYSLRSSDSKNYFSSEGVRPQSDITSLGVKTLYERSGHIISISGQTRKHTKVVNVVPVNYVLKNNFEVELILF